MGGIRQHVRYLAAHPPDTYRTAGVWGPRALADFDWPVPFHPVASMWRLRPPNVDVLHVHGLTVGMVSLRRRRPPVVLSLHMDIAAQGRTASSWILRAVAPRIAAAADARIGVSRLVAGSFSDVRVIAPAVAPRGAPTRSRQAVRAELGTPEDRVVVACVARLHPDKGLDLLIEAIGATDAEGWICGEGPLRARLEAEAAGTGCRLLGYREDIPDLLGAGDVFALPSVGEGYGIAVAEAVMAGLPVVASTAGAMADIVGDAGILVGPGDRAAFSAAVERVVRDDALRRELAERAGRRRLPAPEELVAEVGAVYDEVLA